MIFDFIIEYICIYLYIIVFIDLKLFLVYLLKLFFDIIIDVDVSSILSFRYCFWLKLDHYQAQGVIATITIARLLAHAHALTTNSKTMLCIVTWSHGASTCFLLNLSSQSNTILYQGPSNMSQHRECLTCWPRSQRSSHHIWWHHLQHQLLRRSTQ